MSRPFSMSSMAPMPLRTALAAAAALALIACSVSISFDYTNSSAQVGFTGSTVNPAPIPFDISNQPDVQAHKSNIKSLSLTYLDATVSTVDPTNNVTSITGTVWLRPDGATSTASDMQVGTLSNFPIAVNQTAHFPGSTQLDALVTSIILGSGKGSVVVTGTAQGPASGTTVGAFKLDLKFRLSMEYGT
jgi:hypothetical protein